MAEIFDFMFNHAPLDYDCPFCKIAEGIENEEIETKQADIFFKDAFMTAFIACSTYPKNQGHVIIISNQHFENLYDLPKVLIFKISYLAKKIVVAMKELYPCDGTSLRQHNEPAGGQDVFHYHLHVFPRFENDKLYLNQDDKITLPPEKRFSFVEKLRKYFKYEEE